MSGERQTPSAFDQALRLLAVRPHFRAELQGKLARRGHQEAEIGAALARLDDLGYLDDHTLARAEMERLRARKGLARAGVVAQLRRKGASDESIESALASVPSDDDRELALATARRWARGRSGRADEAAALARHLARKGFNGRVIFLVLKELLPDAEPSRDLD